jgi:hypothetical protein
VAPGSSTALALIGKDLAAPTVFWTSIPGAKSTLASGAGQSAERAAYRLDVPVDTPVGLAGVRLATPGGVSNLRLVMIDDLPTTREQDNNHSIEDAHQIALATAIDGACQPEQSDFFKFSALAGQRLSVEVVARRLGSPLDPVIRLLDRTGKELAYSDDEGGLSADCRFAHSFSADGAYLLEIRDIRYHGGANHFYRLRCGDFPLVTVPYPLGALAGSDTTVSAAGPAVGDRENWAVTVPRDAGDGEINVPMNLAEGRGTAFARLVVGDGPEMVEFEPNDEIASASPVSIPGDVNGRLQDDHDHDYYQFNVTAGQRLVFRGVTRSLGSPTDLFLRLLDAEGKQLAEVDDSGSEEGMINHLFETEGSYALVVEDLHQRGGPQHAYRVEIREHHPDFSLRLEADRFNAPLGGVFAAKVIAERSGCDGPITLALEGVGDDLRLADATIAEGTNETVMRVTVPAVHAAGTMLTGRIVGTAKVEDKEVRAIANTRGAIKEQLSGLAYPPSDLTEEIAIGVGPRFADFFKLTVEPTTIPLPQLIGKATVKVKAERLNGFDEKIDLKVVGLPAGVTAEVGPIEKDKAEIDIAFTGPLAMAEAAYSIQVVGNASHQDQPRQVSVGGLRLEVVKPLAVSITPSGPVSPGGTQKLIVAATRYDNAANPITITFGDIPNGISVPAELTIPEGAAQIEVELQASIDSRLGKAAGLVAHATATVAGRQIAVTSPAAVIEVAMPAPENAQAEK